MLECAADLGDNGRNVAFIVGNREDIRATRSSIPHHFTHMRQIGRNRNQMNIVKSLQKKGDIMMFCFRIDRPQIVKKLSMAKISKLGRSATRKVQICFDYALRQEFQRVLGNYLTRHSTSFNDLVIEVDSDMRKTLKTVGLKTKDVDVAYELADVVAWINTKKISHKDIQEISIVQEIEKSILDRIS